MKYSVIVIGAGMAGLSCCHKLIEYKTKQIKLLKTILLCKAPFKTINIYNEINHL